MAPSIIMCVCAFKKMFITVFVGNAVFISCGYVPQSLCTSLDAFVWGYWTTVPGSAAILCQGSWHKD